MIKATITSLILCITSTIGVSQNLASNQGQGTFGLGIGLPYGAIGARIGYNVANQTNLFLGLGYNLADVGYNFGLMYSFKSEKQSEFYLTGMYGRNASIRVDGSNGFEDIRESYMGPSFGAGLKIHSLRKEGSYWDIGLIVPIRSSSYDNDLNSLQSNPAVEITEAWPITFVIGYNFKL